MGHPLLYIPTACHRISDSSVKCEDTVEVAVIVQSARMGLRLSPYESCDGVGNKLLTS